MRKSKTIRGIKLDGSKKVRCIQIPVGCTIVYEDDDYSATHRVFDIKIVSKNASEEFKKDILELYNLNFDEIVDGVEFIKDNKEHMKQQRIQPNWYKIDNVWYHCMSIDGVNYINGKEQSKYIGE